MARLKEDNTSWKSRSIVRRDARHDMEHLSDEASNGKVRRSKRRARKGCEHEFPEAPKTKGWGSVRCVKCGKRRYWYNGGIYTYRPRQDPTKVYHTQEQFFPVHEPGTCATCDQRREAQAR